MRKLTTAVVFLLLTAFAASADEFTFFGQDLGQGESIRLGAHPNADAARTSFFANLVGVGTETFEGFLSGASAPLTVHFPGAGSATLNGGGSVATVASGTNGVGRYPISGNNYWESSDAFSITFSAPVAAFGFYGVDIGDFSGHLTLSLAGAVTKVINIPNTVNGSGGSVLYFGLIETGTFDSLTFGNTAPGVDFFGFDDFSVGALEQVHPTVPEPSAYLLMATAFVGVLGGLRRKLRQ